MDSMTLTKSALANFEPKHAVIILAAYLIGAIPFGLLMGRMFAKIDVRELGSGNIGATNVARSVGKKLGAVVLLLDMLKGLLTVLGVKLMGIEGAVLGATGLAAVIGHCFPIYLRLRGGKGVATALGAFLALSPIAALVGMAAYVTAFAITRISSMGSMALLLGTLITAVLLHSPAWMMTALVIISALIVVRHRANLLRLVHGKEARF